MGRSSNQNINKDIATLNNALDQMDLTDIYRTFHLKEAKYTFFSNAHGIFSKIDHVIGHKTSLNKFKNTEIISSILSDHKGLKLETNLKEKTQKHSKTMNGTIISQKKSKSFWKQIKMNSQQPKTYGTQRRQS